MATACRANGQQADACMVQWQLKDLLPSSGASAIGGYMLPASRAVLCNDSHCFRNTVYMMSSRLAVPTGKGALP